MAARVFVFDFDGVIADTTKLKAEYFLDLFRGHPEFSKIEKYEEQNGARPRAEKLNEICRDILGLSGSDLTWAVEKFVSEYTLRLESALPVAPTVTGLREFISQIRASGAKLYIASAAPAGEIDVYLKRNLPSVKWEKIFGVGTRKADALRAIANENQLSTDAIFFFGDNLSDWQAAKDSGTQFVTINPANEMMPPGFKNFAELMTSPIFSRMN